VYTLKYRSVRPSVHPSVHPYLLSCLSLSVPGPVYRWDRTKCRGGRSERPTQFQVGSQLLLVLRRSAKNERRTRGVCVVWRRSACLYLWSRLLVIRIVSAAESREVRTSSVLSIQACSDLKDRIIPSDIPEYIYPTVRDNLEDWFAGLSGVECSLFLDVTSWVSSGITTSVENWRQESKGRIRFANR